VGHRERKKGDLYDPFTQNDAGDRPTGKQIARHLQEVFQALPRCVVSIAARADSGFYCWEAVEAYEIFKCSFIVVARKTSRLLEELVAAK
jgi:hypothetical protein